MVDNFSFTFKSWFRPPAPVTIDLLSKYAEFGALAAEQLKVPFMLKLSLWCYGTAIIRAAVDFPKEPWKG